MSTQNLVELSRQCELNEGILRQLFVRLPDALVEPILEHAKGAKVLTPVADVEATPKGVVEEVTAS